MYVCVCSYFRSFFHNSFFYQFLTKNGTTYDYARVKRWTRKVDLFAMEKVFIPIHLGTHWCLAILNMTERRVEYYDSLGHDNHPCVTKLRKYLQDEHRDKRHSELDLSEWRNHVPTDIPQQGNGYDCGVFACQYAAFAMRRSFVDAARDGHPFAFSQSDMPHFRLLMMLQLLEAPSSAPTDT